MQPEQHGNKSGKKCEEFGPRWTLFTAGELDAAEVAEMNEHVLHCANCNATLAQENAPSESGRCSGSGRRAWLAATSGEHMDARELDFTGAGVERGFATCDWFFGGNTGGEGCETLHCSEQRQPIRDFEFGEYADGSNDSG